MSEVSNISDPVVDEPIPRGEYGDAVPKEDRFGWKALAVAILVGLGIAIIVFASLGGGEASPEALEIPTAQPTRIVLAPTSVIGTDSPTPEGGATPSPTRCLPSSEPIDIIWIIDESGSVGNYHYSVLKEEIKSFADNFNFSATRFGLIEFSGENHNGEYPSTNLKDTAIQETINLFDYDDVEDFKARVDEIQYTPVDPDFCDKDGNPVPPATDCLYPQRIYTCISCAFQYALDEYFPATNGEGQANAIEDRKRFIIFVGDGVFNRGNPKEPEQPVMDLRAVYDFQLIFLPLDGNKGVTVDWFGAAFRTTSEPGSVYNADTQLDVASYDDLALLEDLNVRCI